MYGVLNRLAKYDIEKQTLLKAAELDHSYYCITVSNDGSKIYLAGTHNHVAVFDADSLERLNTITLPGGRYVDDHCASLYPLRRSSLQALPQGSTSWCCLGDLFAWRNAKDRIKSTRVDHKK